MTEAIVVAACVIAGFYVVGDRRSGRRRPRHSFVYRHYIDNNSRLWRTRKFVWYWTSSRRCKQCGRRLAAPGHGSPRRPVVTFHHVTYARLGRERRSDVRLLCWPCHSHADSWRYR